MTAPLVPGDLYRITRATDLRLLRDERGAVARIETFDRLRDTIVGRLWLVRDDAMEPVSDGPEDRSPAIAPDGATLAFASGAMTSQIILRRLDRDARITAVGAVHASIDDLAWSPDGRTIAFTAPAVIDARTATISVDERTGARHILAFPYKSDAGGLLDGRRRAVFVVDVATGDTRRLTGGGTDAGAPAWSPDGTTIAYAARVPAVDANACSAVFIVDVASTNVRVVTAGDGAAYRPVFSQDGGTIAFAGHRHGNDNRFNLEAFVVPFAGGEVRSLTAAYDRPIGNVLCGDLRSGVEPRVAWLPGGREVVVQVTEGGACIVRAFALADGSSRTIAGGDRDIAVFAVGAAGTFAIAYSTPVEPSVVALVSPDGRERRLSALNPWLAERTLAVPERFAATADDDVAVEAWLMRPQTGFPAPLVLAIHPGPHAAFGWTFVLEYQILAAGGIGIAFGNPRGSLGYGNAYAQAITADWGGADARDVLAIVDAAMPLGSFDTQRVACIGQSYGGFLTTWLLGHTTRFATGVSMDAVNDFVSLYGTSDVGWFMDSELAADTANDAGRALFESSALRAARRIAAPLLIMHSERDYRCPVDQAEQLFNTLRFLGKTNVEFVRFQDGGHELSRSGNPRERVLRLRAIANWLVRYLRPDRPVHPSPAGWLFDPLPGEMVHDA